VVEFICGTDGIQNYFCHFVHALCYFERVRGGFCQYREYVSPLSLDTAALIFETVLIAFRVCSGASAASAQSIGAGVIASIWETKQRGEAMGYFYLGTTPPYRLKYLITENS
jgi:hypothetical protein